MARQLDDALVDPLGVLVDKIAGYHELARVIGRVWPVLFWLHAAARERHLQRARGHAPQCLGEPQLSRRTADQAVGGVDTLAERMRAGGSGIPAFFTATGVGTQVAEGGLPWKYDADGNVEVSSPAKEVREFETAEGTKEFVMERAIVTDFGLVRAWKGDRHGNLVYRQSAQNFNPLAAMAGRVTIAEVEHLVEPGEIDPAEVHTPGVYVQRVVALTPEQAADKRIEKRTVRPRPADAPAGAGSTGTEA